MFSAGILRTVKNTQDGTKTAMENSLQDLEALMVKAKDMVKLAAELNEKLTAVTTAQAAASSSTTAAYSSTSTLVTSEPEEATFIRSSLSQLGLQISNAPVTLDMMKDERRWFEELARELARVLQGGGTIASLSIRDRDRDSIGGGMMKERGIIALDEVWGGWNRARGVGKYIFIPLIPRSRGRMRPMFSISNPNFSCFFFWILFPPGTSLSALTKTPTSPFLRRRSFYSFW